MGNIMGKASRRPKIIAVDFDGTLAENAYPGIGEPKDEVIQYCLDQKAKGAQLILWTNRVGDQVDEAVEWCRQHGLTFDAVNDNLPQMIEFFGGNPRKIFANEYIDDRMCTRFRFKKNENKISDWATREVEFACSFVRENYPEDCVEKTIREYKAALRAVLAAIEDDPDGEWVEIPIVRDFVSQLFCGECLTPILDRLDEWEQYCNPEDGRMFYQCKRYPPLMKTIEKDGTATYHDYQRFECYDLDSDSGIPWHHSTISYILNPVLPITFPYRPSIDKIRVYFEEFLTDLTDEEQWKPGNYDTLAIHYAEFSNGSRVDLNLCFKSEDGGEYVPISTEEFWARKARKVTV